MNILILNGSPRRRGNTHAVLEQIEKQLGSGHHVEFINVSTLKLSGCVACDACKKNGGHCIRPDESDATIQKIAQADVLIFGTPVYWWGMSSQLKTLVDKFYSQTAQFKTMAKKIGLVVVGASGVEDKQYQLIHDQFACIAAFLNWDFRFFLPFSAHAAGEVMEQTDVLDKVKNACAELCR